LLHLKSGRKSEAVRLHGNLSTNDGEVAVNWAVGGLGIVLRAEWDVARYLRSGRLQQVLGDWETPPADIHAVYAARHANLLRVQVFVDHLVRWFAA
jgi:LysR family transcriptional regulator, transcriptional activator for dmlA